MKISEILTELESAEFPAGQDLHGAKYLLAELLQTSIVDLFLLRNNNLTLEQSINWKEAYKRYMDGEPPQYIIGKAYFWGLEFKVDRRCLIPRPETEGLVELVLSRMPKGSTILDIGTGSGAIAIAIKKQSPETIVWATDIDQETIQLAQENAQLHAVDINFCKADLFPESNIRFDVIISNPPYISQNEYNRLDRSIKDFEPQEALLAQDDGLIFYRRILEKCSRYVGKGVYIFFEIGETQAASIKSIAKKLSFTNIETRRDLSGRDRYVLIHT